jgi:hypothetical protein
MQFHRLSRPVPAVLTSVASAQIVVPAGFNVTVYPIGMQLTGLGLAPPGPFDERLCVSVSGSIRVVDPLSGAVTVFASGLDAFVGPCGTHFNATSAAQVTAGP